MHEITTNSQSGIAAGGCKTHCNSCAKCSLQLEVAKRTVLAARRREFGLRTGSWEAAQRRRSPDEWLLREEVAERRGTSAKRSLGEEIAQQGKAAHSSIHPPIHQLIYLFIPSFADSTSLVLYLMIH